MNRTSSYDVGGQRVDVVRSARRRRTVSARREGDRTVVMVPAHLGVAEEQRWVTTMLERLARSERRRRPGDVDLTERARSLSTRYLDGRAQPTTVRWVTNQKMRWGSCTPAEGSIRLSTRLQGMPDWVVDYVLLHELAHLLVAGHGPAFWRLVERYPRCERARGYLEGVAATARLPLSDESDEEEDEGRDEGPDDDVDAVRPPAAPTTETAAVTPGTLFG